MSLMNAIRRAADVKRRGGSDSLEKVLMKEDA